MPNTTDGKFTDIDYDALRKRYEQERNKRLRGDGNAQYSELKGNADFDRDPFADPDFSREPVSGDTLVTIVGGGFGGMLAAVNLVENGITDFRIVEKAGDFGGTWYWNRYPGCMCDVESYTYLPLLEETGYMPTMKYASAPEIFAYCQLIGRTWNLYDRALFQTEIIDAAWDDSIGRWRLTTTRGDDITSKYLVIAGGILHKAKLPGIPGIDEFEGHKFHASRWDYAYTGGGPVEGTVMDKLADKRVGIIGTGATAVQAVPQLANVAKELFVFQRTPSAVGERNNGPTDVEWFASLQPGWHKQRVENFSAAVTGREPEVDLVNDGWTEVMWRDTAPVTEDPEVWAAAERSDFDTMEALRRRVDDLVVDPETAEKLKPYYGKTCKRVCFHDDYLPAFNRPNVHLVDTEGRGVERITAKGPVVDGVEYPVDLLVFASGFENGTDYDRRIGFDPKGRNGVSLSQAWSKGPRTLHGVFAGDFPNLLMISTVQGAFGTNYVHFLSEVAHHIADVIAMCEEEGVQTIEASPDGEDGWLMTLYGFIGGFVQYQSVCTPSYYNGEQGEPDEKAERNLIFFGNVMEYAGIVDEWRARREFAGVTLTRG